MIKYLMKSSLCFLHQWNGAVFTSSNRQHPSQQDCPQDSPQQQQQQPYQYPYGGQQEGYCDPVPAKDTSFLGRLKGFFGRLRGRGKGPGQSMMQDTRRLPWIWGYTEDTGYKNSTLQTVNSNFRVEDIYERTQIVPF